MPASNRDGLASGLVMGVSITFFFALVIRFIPIAVWVARFRAESPRQVLLWAVAGSLAFDGLVLGFWPALYGQVGEARTAVGTLLLWAFAWIVAAALRVAPQRAGKGA